MFGLGLRARPRQSAELDANGFRQAFADRHGERRVQQRAAIRLERAAVSDATAAGAGLVDHDPLARSSAVGADDPRDVGRSPAAKPTRMRIGLFG